MTGSLSCVLCFSFLPFIDSDPDMWLYSDDQSDDFQVHSVREFTELGCTMKVANIQSSDSLSYKVSSRAPQPIYHHVTLHISYHIIPYRWNHCASLWPKHWAKNC